MQSENRLFDDVARVATGAIGTLQGVKQELAGIIRQQFAKILDDMELVSRDEFEAVKAMAAEARAENERLAARLAQLEDAQAKPKRRPRKTAGTTKQT